VTTDEPVTRASLSGCEPIIAPLPLTELPDRVWTDAEWQRVRLGHRSRAVVDKWDVFVEGNRLYAQRSWAGRGIYEAEFGPADGGGWRIVEALVESDPDAHRRTTEARDCAMLQIIVSSVVLGVRDPGLWARWREAVALH